MKKIVTVSILATSILTAMPITPVFAATTGVKTENVLMDRKRFDHIKSKETSKRPQTYFIIESRRKKK